MKNNFEFYRVGKKMDWLLDHIPYGWRIYYKYRDAYTSVISTYQKMRYGCSDRECWNLGFELARIIHTKLSYFKKTKQSGYPARLVSDYGFGLELEVKQEELCIQKWQEILDEMIWTFDYIADEEKYIVFPPELLIKYTNSKDLCKDYNREKTPLEKQIWDQHVKKCEVLDARKQKGLELFAKYIENLWD